MVFLLTYECYKDVFKRMNEWMKASSERWHKWFHASLLFCDKKKGNKDGKKIN